ncbi:hypothetical protein OIU76_023514 [Salix suchowensis]|nr:hypothetical protein OIU76_023514 [Salix suchowensis]
MKTVTGNITNSTPVTIAKAASILSKFVFSETGASQALNAYLRRATAAFDELEQLLKKEVKGEGSVGDEETERKKEKKRRKKGDLAEETQKSNGIKKEKAEVEENGGEVLDKIEIRENGEKKKKKEEEEWRGRSKGGEGGGREGWIGGGGPEEKEEEEKTGG